jgi:hypothetical protein
VVIHGDVLVLKHNCPRLIYGACGSREMPSSTCAAKPDKPEFILSRRDSLAGTSAVVDHWLVRWLLPRSKREESLVKRPRSQKTSVSAANWAPQ